jgi:DNA polymerase-3 subunit gamma/tau
MATYQSLYRRYRSQRFDEVLGQDHVTQALRNAVRDGRVGHAYLFSGPRGTGKTSTARILAKVLNCAAPEDGEPCGKCENCVAVAEGRVVDWLLEQDAASKSKVDDMRDLLDRVPLGTSGNRKVIILDEVHMLSQGAENALLKTLEEPPAHVVFVLATTDPQKVRPTILSRTQHFTFRLLQPDVMAGHVRHVIEDAGLRIDAAEIDQAVDHVVRAGGGSARDALSALDQVAALGTVVDEGRPVDAILDALADRDAGRVLLGVADALAAGRDPRGLGEAIIAGLRDAFLSLMGAADEHLAPDARARAAEVGERFGAPGLTRALDVLGEALTELSRKPDPRVVVEVALVRLTQPSTDRTLDAVVERLDRLERGLVGGAPGAAARATAPSRSEPAATRAEAAGAADASSGGDGTDTAADAATPPERTSGGGRPRRAASAARDALSSARKPEDPGAEAPASTRRSGRPTLGALSRGAAAGGNDSPKASPEESADPDTTSRAAGSGPEPDAVGSSGSDAGGRAAGSDREGNVAGSSTSGTRGRPAKSSQSSAQGRAAGRNDASSAAGGSSVADAVADTSAGAVGAATAAGTLTAGEIEAAWGSDVLGALPVKVRSRWRSGRWADIGAGAWQFAVPNSWHKGACEETTSAVEQALASRFGRPVTVTVVVDDEAAPTTTPGDPGGAGMPTPGQGAGGGADDADEHIDPSDLRDADDAPGNGVDLVLREFGGGQVVEEGS